MSLITGIISSWEQIVTWLVLFAILYSVISGKIRFDLAAFGGLLLLGIIGLRSPLYLFDGFSSPALFTIAIVLVMSAGIVESGLLSGLGKKIAHKIHNPRNQILVVFLSTGFISAFMNNVGAVGIILPTAKRMAQRIKVPQAAFGTPLAYASILGGSLTLIGTASNLIISAYRLNAFGKPFKMFDFLPHGLALLFSGIFIVFLCRVCGVAPIGQESSNTAEVKEQKQQIITDDPRPFDNRKSSIVLATLFPAIIFTSAGIVHPAISFGIISLIWIFADVLPYKTAIENINISLIIFLGSMFGISAILEETGALKSVVAFIDPLFTGLPPFLMIMIFLFITALFANILDNSVAAVLMAPLAVVLWEAGVVQFNPDALLMAVAAGASLGLVLPTHQATIVIMDSMEFPRQSFIKTGAAIAAVAGIFSAFVIYMIWC